MTEQEIDDLLNHLEIIFVRYPYTSIYHKKALSMYGKVNRIKYALYPPKHESGYVGNSSTVAMKVIREKWIS
ncbi:hypothetical protein phiOC_p125 [Ochrobactrum phage vB_OspM_OC]|nr:hypothetical protein phiOC_p125 [Ochrobactrum phage vB_OspM_OC]